MPQTVAEAINKAKATETAFSMGADLSAYSINSGYLPNLYGAAVPAQTAHVAFMSRMTETPSLNNIETIIEQKLKEQIEKALNRDTFNNDNSNRNNNNRNSNNRNQNRNKECYYCKKKGHIARDCWNKNRQQNTGPTNVNNNYRNNNNQNKNRSSGNGRNNQQSLN